uniref:Uncharacterized protein n=1 Tax=Pyxicephalus adspersus TaxID=30357 RepID=A0AAV3A3Y7_PYXAD|nr:TPA: hypothetical protein GDO54_013263 [Pyxicephalus adspersus]
MMTKSFHNAIETWSREHTYTNAAAICVAISTSLVYHKSCWVLHSEKRSFLSFFTFVSIGLECEGSLNNPGIFSSHVVSLVAVFGFFIPQLVELFVG